MTNEFGNINYVFNSIFYFMPKLLPATLALFVNWWEFSSDHVHLLVALVKRSVCSIYIGTDNLITNHLTLRSCHGFSNTVPLMSLILPSRSVIISHHYIFRSCSCWLSLRSRFASNMAISFITCFRATFFSEPHMVTIMIIHAGVVSCICDRY